MLAGIVMFVTFVFLYLMPVPTLDGVHVVIPATTPKGTEYTQTTYDLPVTLDFVVEWLRGKLLEVRNAILWEFTQ